MRFDALCGLMCRLSSHRAAFISMNNLLLQLCTIKGHSDLFDP